jgi:hypothetical protein
MGVGLGGFVVIILVDYACSFGINYKSGLGRGLTAEWWARKGYRSGAISIMSTY